MKSLFLKTLLAALLAVALSPAQAENWPGWRGPRTDGTSLDKNAPASWTEKEITWKTALPGVGHSSPIVWGDRIFTATAFPEKQERALLCVDRASGKILWNKTVVTGPLEKIHKENSYASGTPVTDGERVYVMFRVGDEIVVAAHDFKTGEQVWLKRPGTHAGEWGFSNSPVLYQNMVIVDGDSKGDSFVAAFNRADGKEIWKVKRSNKGISYSAPFIRELAGRIQMIQCGDRCVTSFDPNDGSVNWTVDGPSEEFCATPVYNEKAGLVYVSSSWPKQILLAIRPDGKGNVTQTKVAWRDNKGGPYVPSMLAAGDTLMTVNNSGTAYCFEAATGKVLWTEKFGRTHASPVLINGLAYFTNDNGQIEVVKPGATFERKAQLQLGEPCYASMAVSDGQIFIRGFKNLYCIGKRAQ